MFDLRAALEQLCPYPCHSLLILISSVPIPTSLPTVLLPHVHYYYPHILKPAVQYEGA